MKVLIGIGLACLICVGCSKEAPAVANSPATIQAIAAKYQQRAVFPFEIGKPIKTDHKLAKCSVESVAFKKNEKGELVATVRIVGISQEPENPNVNVTIYDKDGRDIGRAGVVGFIQKELAKDQVKDISDLVPISAAITPVAFSIDDEYTSPS